MFPGLNPTVFYVGLIVLFVGALVGENLHVVPSGYATTILGAIIGAGGVHSGAKIGSNLAASASS